MTEPSESTKLEGLASFAEYVGSGKLKGKRALITGGEYVSKQNKLKFTNHLFIVPGLVERWLFLWPERVQMSLSFICHQSNQMQRQPRHQLRKRTELVFLFQVTCEITTYVATQWMNM